LAQARLDVVGIGLNAMDIVAQVNRFPSPGGKVRIESLNQQAGGQTATALVTCQRLGLRARYIGRVGDDEGGRLQLASLRREGLDLRYVRLVPGATTQLGFIVVEGASGERTVFWHRDPRLAVSPSDLKGDYLGSARVLHLDGCDVAACLRAARHARRVGAQVVADLDTVYPEVERLLPYIDYLIAASDFPPAITGVEDPFKSLDILAREYKTQAVGMTLGRDGALVFCGRRYYYSPGFIVEAVDTTGAGDVFHGGFIYGLVRGWEMERRLDFANAMAALNCTALGARGGIASEAAAERLMARGRRRVNREYARRCSVGG
jgi:sugar/nucleoside kinase (ribokinase family)